MADLTGEWLGTYWQQGQPTRFEATLIQNGNTLTGNILDNNHLGEARLNGDVIGRRVQFIKQYIIKKKCPSTIRVLFQKMVILCREHGILVF
jgi:hypothetical protein